MGVFTSGLSELCWHCMSEYLLEIPAVPPCFPGADPSRLACECKDGVRNGLQRLASLMIKCRDLAVLKVQHTGPYGDQEYQ